MNLWISDLKEVLKASVNINNVQLWNPPPHTPLPGLFMANVKLKGRYPIGPHHIKDTTFLQYLLVCAQVKLSIHRETFSKRVIFSKQSNYYVFWGREFAGIYGFDPVLTLLKLYF